MKYIYQRNEIRISWETNTGINYFICVFAEIYIRICRHPNAVNFSFVLA